MTIQSEFADAPTPLAVELDDWRANFVAGVTWAIQVQRKCREAVSVNGGLDFPTLERIAAEADAAALRR